MEHLSKERLARGIKTLKIGFNSLSEGQAKALIGWLIKEESGIDRNIAFKIALQLGDLNAVNYSAMRKKIGGVVFGKKIEGKRSAEEIGLALLEEAEKAETEEEES